MTPQVLTLANVTVCARASCQPLPGAQYKESYEALTNWEAVSAKRRCLKHQLRFAGCHVLSYAAGYQTTTVPPPGPQRHCMEQA